MKRFFETLRNIWRVEELKNRILLTLGLILVFRIGSFIVLPGVDTLALERAASNADEGGLIGILNLFSGGAFNNASIMALGIMPYISASIIMQLLGMAVPAVQKMQKEGESGRNKINSITRWLTIAICAAQAPSYLGLYVGSADAIIESTPLWWIQSTLILVAGTMFSMWLGERITDKGIGNGISLIITVGILAGLPAAFLQEIISKSSNPIMIIMEIVLFMVVVLVTVLVVQGVRKVPVSVAKKIVQSRGAVETGGVRDYIPLKVNASGVMPIIFAQAVMTVPVMLMSSMSEGEGGGSLMGFGDMFGLGYNAVLFVLILVFTYFYTAIMINPKQMAEDMKMQGSFIPGVKPGEETATYLDELISRITLPGAIFLGLIAIIPAFAKLSGVTDNFSMFYGGTSLLIMVAVVMDTLQQIESYLLNRHYDGLMEGTKVRGRRTDTELSGF